MRRQMRPDAVRSDQITHSRCHITPPPRSMMRFHFMTELLEILGE